MPTEAVSPVIEETSSQERPPQRKSHHWALNLLGVGLVPVRKLGKLPGDTLSVEYELEYGTNTLEIHRDAIRPGQRVLVVDDLLATGGTVLATIDLVRQLGGVVAGTAFLIELEGLGGRDRLDCDPVISLLTY